MIPVVGSFVCIAVSTAIFIQLFPLQVAPPEGNWVFWDSDNTKQGSMHTGPSINPNLCCSLS